MNSLYQNSNKPLRVGKASQSTDSKETLHVQKSRPANGDWEQDLQASRDVNDRDKQGFSLVLSWFESWRLRHRLPPGRDAGKRFWMEEVVSKPRKDWQLQQWTEAMRWYLHWLEVCHRDGCSTVSLAERVRDAVETVGARRGLALRTRQTYGGWCARFAQWAECKEDVRNPEQAKMWLTELVAKGRVA